MKLPLLLALCLSATVSGRAATTVTALQDGQPVKFAPRPAGEIEKLAVALLVSCTYEVPANFAREEDWARVLAGSNIRIVFTEPRKLSGMSVTVPVKIRETTVREMLIPISAYRSQERILIRLDARFREFSKGDADALIALQKCLVDVLAENAGSDPASEISRTAIIQERDNVLAQILRAREASWSSGTDVSEARVAARLALYSFRRDAAPTFAEKIKNQELIVLAYGRQLDGVKLRVDAGITDALEVLEAKAAFLEAKQLLEELRLKEKSG